MQSDLFCSYEKIHVCSKIGFYAVTTGKGSTLGKVQASFMTHTHPTAITPTQIQDSKCKILAGSRNGKLKPIYEHITRQDQV